MSNNLNELPEILDVSHIPELSGCRQGTSLSVM